MMALAKFRKIISGGIKKPTKDLSTSSKDPKITSDPKKQVIAGLAQLVEHLTCNEVVAGSNPASGSA